MAEKLENRDNDDDDTFIIITTILIEIYWNGVFVMFEHCELLRRFLKRVWAMKAD